MRAIALPIPLEAPVTTTTGDTTFFAAATFECSTAATWALIPERKRKKFLSSQEKANLRIEENQRTKNVAFTRGGKRGWASALARDSGKERRRAEACDERRRATEMRELGGKLRRSSDGVEGDGGGHWESENGLGWRRRGRRRERAKIGRQKRERKKWKRKEDLEREREKGLLWRAEFSLYCWFQWVRSRLLCVLFSFPTLQNNDVQMDFFFF